MQFNTPAIRGCFLCYIKILDFLLFLSIIIQTLTKGIQMSKSYHELEIENQELKKHILQQQQELQDLQTVVQHQKQDIFDKQQGITDRDMLLVAFKNRLVFKKHWWQRIIQNKSDTNYLLTQLTNLWTNHKQKQ